MPRTRAGESFPPARRGPGCHVRAAIVSPRGVRAGTVVALMGRRTMGRRTGGRRTGRVIHIAGASIVMILVLVLAR
ncbi:hypothetical protein GCM10010446_24580 [Streptomyces enissocaesilis]|uniref:Uncharacterized protein n=1 Tax=Streptomyces enissocaesilis TaxID=332589 RepID=A0ABN3X772_9ACTN